MIWTTLAALTKDYVLISTFLLTDALIHTYTLVHTQDQDQGQAKVKQGPMQDRGLGQDEYAVENQLAVRGIN
jgi:hypothetical protein